MLSLEIRVLTFWSLVFFVGCSNGPEGSWDYQVNSVEQTGVMKITKHDGLYEVILVPSDNYVIELKNVQMGSQTLSGSFELYEVDFNLTGSFQDDKFKGELRGNKEVRVFEAIKQSEQVYTIDRSHIKYYLSEADLDGSESNIDHAGIIADLDFNALVRGARIYNSNCINCHGTPEIEGSIPLSTKFWKQPFKAGSDAFSMYQTITRGYGSMPPQVGLTPREKYDVILYIQQEFISKKNNEQYISSTPGYLKGLPKGKTLGPDTKPYHPWSDMDYGNFFINTYELVDQETGPERYHSPGPPPYPDEDYSKNNFAYKGIAVRLDEGPGGVSKGKAWTIFDHDLMRVAGAWTGNDFIDWEGILLNDRHETYPRTNGKLHFETPVAPGWANPVTGSFEDPRFRARDGRAFGPLPKVWADFKGIYYYEDYVVVSYWIGDTKVLEKFGVEFLGDNPVFTRTLHVSASNEILKTRIAPATSSVTLSGQGASLSQEGEFMVLNIEPSTESKLKVYVTNGVSVKELVKFSNKSALPESLEKYTNGGPPHYQEELVSEIITGSSDSLIAVDKLIPPFNNPWNCRMKLSGLDFMSNPNKAVACATDGDIWLITGLTENKGTLTWKRIGSGLFQPLGIKVLDDKIYVTCRDQLVLLHDLNGDDETDFYESFNHDHQVTDHFHEFAMGLQSDKQGNLYYAKSGRHAREALIPQHGTLIKVNQDGSGSEIIATGFRAANGVCINPDGSFIVTDQQGFWNPMNRINWIAGKGNFYGNMWGFDPPEDTSRAAMEPPAVWLDMDFDRSPSEMVWVDSEKWGPLDGSLLSFSYGFGKIQLVLPERVKNQMQGGVIDLPGVKFLTGVMRGRFNPADGHLYACGMSAWGTSQLMRGGGLYRLRYNHKSLPLPIDLKAWEWGLELSFASTLKDDAAKEISNYQIKTWDLVRSSAYGSDRLNQKTLDISKIELLPGGKTVKLFIENIRPVDVMTISYDILDNEGRSIQGKVQNTIHNLRSEPGA